MAFISVHYTTIYDIINNKTHYIAIYSFTCKNILEYCEFLWLLYHKILK